MAERTETCELIVAPPRRSKATALPPGVPLWSPSIRRPRLSCRPDGGWPLMRSWTGLVSAKGFFGVSVTVFLAALYTADFSLMSLAFLASKEFFLPAVARR